MAVVIRITPSGPAYATAAETRAAVIAEATKPANDAGGRPLPLAANWNMYSTPLSWQLAKIDEGYPILPFVSYEKTMTTAAFVATGYPNGNADALSDLAARGLPFSLQYPNFSSPLYDDAAYATGTSDADSACTLWPHTVTAAVASGTTSVTVTVSNAAVANAIVGSSATFSGFTGGWAALNGPQTIASVNGGAKTITVNVDGSGFGAWASGGKVVARSKYLSPMGTDSPWAALGTEQGTCDVIEYLQAQYPNPPRVLVIDNNESGKISPSQYSGDQRVEDNYPTLYANMAATPRSYWDQVLELWHYNLIDRHNAMFDAFDASLTEPGWEGRVKFVGYNAGLDHNFRISDSWWQQISTWGASFDQTDFNRIAWQPYAWDGWTPNLYYWNNFAWYPFETFSQQNIAMVFKFAQDIAETVNPNYWGEFSSWDGELFDGGAHSADALPNTPNSDMLKTLGIDYTPEYFKGWLQYCVWLLRPRCVREFRYHYHPNTGFLDLSDTDTEHGARWQMHLDMVSHVHQEPVLRRFWREGTLVENTAKLVNTDYAHPFQWFSGYSEDVVKALVWDAYPKNYHLPTRLDHVDEYVAANIGGSYRIATYTEDGRVDYPVWALAYVIGTAPNREWLVYAHSSGIEGATLSNVVVTIPGYQDITLPTVPVEGAFYFVQEADIREQRRGGGDDALRHPGWSRKRSEEKARKEQRLTESIKATLEAIKAPAPEASQETARAAPAKRALDAEPLVRALEQRAARRLNRKQERAAQTRLTTDHTLHLSREAQIRAAEREIADILDEQQEAEDEQLLAKLLPHLF